VTDPRGPDEIASTLITYLRGSIGPPALDYAEPPSQIFGGNRSFVYGFRLRDAPAPYSKRLILRVSRSTGGGESTQIEAAIPTALADLGYPVPRVLDWSDSRDPFGGAFMMMERLEGSPLVLGDPPEEMTGRSIISHLLPELGRLLFGHWPSLLAGIQAQLHDLSTDSFLRKLESDGLQPGLLGIDSAVDRLAASIGQHPVEGLRPGLDWLLENCPSTNLSSICHGDFFPNQVFEQDGVVTGVIDWSDVIIGPAELDVGIVKAGIETLPAPWGGVGLALQRRIAGRYVAAYRRLRSLDPPALRYGEAFRCFRTLMSVAVRRLGAEREIGIDVGPNPYDNALAEERLTSRFLALTGVPVTAARTSPK
jgi:aminoglycoside phosphotransferase (APT) family kinase protein